MLADLLPINVFVRISSNAHDVFRSGVKMWHVCLKLKPSAMAIDVLWELEQLFGKASTVQ